MIPTAHLDAWRQQAPWPNEVDIEQDLVLSRLIVEIAGDPLLGQELAFRGGTCLYKVHLREAVRYSNDLDYTRTTSGPIGDVMAGVRRIVTAAGLAEARYKQGPDVVNMKFDAEPARGIGRIRVKIEINTREVHPWADRIRLPYRVDNPWFRGSADVLTFDGAELLGTKLRALFQRRKGRDLFDLWLGLTRLGTDGSRVVAAFRHYLGSSGATISRAEFEANLDEKVRHAGFRSDLDQLLVESFAGYDVDTAADLIRRELLSRLA